MKQAEVAAYFRRFEDAEKIYLDMDRRWSAFLCFKLDMVMVNIINGALTSCAVYI